MSVNQYEDYLNEVKTSHQQFKVETLRIQRKLLYSICNHHLLWAKHTDNPEIAAIHMKVADSVQETIDQYDQIAGRS
jgi:hypothetical protein